VDGNGKIVATVDVPVWASGLGVYYSFVDGSVGDSADQKAVAMVLDVGLAGRHLRGDLFDQEAVRKALLNGDTRRNFYGLEIGLGIQYEQIKAGITYYFMNGRVNGLSHGQVVAGVSVQANLNSGRLKSGPDKEKSGNENDKCEPGAGNVPAPEPADSGQ
jgi:hypothetical protein